jgi:hypothetical protein
MMALEQDLQSYDHGAGRTLNSLSFLFTLESSVDQSCSYLTEDATLHPAYLLCSTAPR